MHTGHRQSGTAVKRHMAGDHFVEDDAQRINIGLRGYLLTLGLFRRKVMNRAYHVGIKDYGFI